MNYDQTTDDGTERRNETVDERSGGDRSLTRRTVMKAASTAVVGSVVGLGADAVAAQTVGQQSCEGGDTIPVGDGDGVVINNDWGTSEADMCIYRYDDGSYGWDWSRGAIDGDPNYPEVLIGTKPWGTDTGVAAFPVRFDDVEEFDVDLDVETTTSGSDWNLALEWWHTSERPGPDVGDSITHEIMLVLEWGDGHSHGGVIEPGAITDAYGNEIDYWQHYTPEDGWDWHFHIFRLAANEAPSDLDLTAIVDYLETAVDDPVGFSDLWLTGLEIGNEYWENTAGETTFETLDVTVNGETATTGSDGSSGDGSGGGDDTGDGGDGGSSGELNAEMRPSTTSASVGERVTFGVEDATGDQTWLTEVAWDFGDGATATGWWVSHSYDAPGTYTVALTATDNEGTATTHEVEITVG